MISSTRPQAVQSFLDAVKRGFEQARPEARTEACLARVFERLRDPVPAAAGGGTEVPTSAMLETALGPARQAGGVMADLAGKLGQLRPLLRWRMRGGPDTPPDDGPGSIANAMIVGPNGIEDRKDVWVGLSLVPPGIGYPEHSHPPEEIYLFLTEGRFRHGESGWFTPGVGGSLYNEPGILHAMQAPATAPLLAVWCLSDPRHQ